MKKVYNSKIGLELIVPIVLVLGVVAFLTANKNANWLGIAILLPVILFIVHIFATTNYTIEDGRLTIKCGFLFKKTIDVKTIKKISETNNPLSSPATSLDRLEITYGKSASLMISPKQKKEFIADITALNSGVKVKFKKESPNAEHDNFVRTK